MTPDPVLTEYILGTNDAEVERLGFQHRLWSRLALEGWERARFRRGQRILDVGCGPGYATLDLAQFVSAEGHITAVDVSEKFIAHLNATLEALHIASVEAFVADVQSLDLEPNRFDGAWARWVLCFLPDPAAAVHAVARGLKPGGRFIVQDYYHYRAVTLAPSSDLTRRIIEAVNTSWSADGGDPNIGQRLPAMMSNAGLEVESVRPIIRTARPHEPLWQWPCTFFRNFLPVLVEKRMISQDDADAFMRLLEEPQEDAVLYTPPMVEIIGVKR